MAGEYPRPRNRNEFLDTQEMAHRIGPVGQPNVSALGAQSSRFYLNAPSAFVAFVPDSIAEPLQQGAPGSLLRELTTETWDGRQNELPLPWARAFFPATFDRLPVLCLWCDKWVHYTGERSSREILDPGGLRHLRLSVDGLANFADTDAKLSVTVTARLSAPLVQVVYRSWRDSVLLANGVAGWQRDTTSSALRFPREWFADPACGRLVVTTGPPGFDLCDGISCGPHGQCVDGVCVCQTLPSYYGEFCEVEPASPELFAASGVPEHDGASDVVVLVRSSGFDVLRRPTTEYDRAFRSPLQVSLSPGLMLRPDSPLAIAFPNSSAPLRAWNLTVRPTDPDAPTDLTVGFPHDALMYSKASNTLTLRYRPVVRLSCASTSVIRSRAARQGGSAAGLLMAKGASAWPCRYDGLRPLHVLIESSGRVKDLAAAAAVGLVATVNGGSVNLTVTSVEEVAPGRACVAVLSLPPLAHLGWPSVSLQLPTGRLAGGRSHRSNVLEVRFELRSLWLMAGGGIVKHLGSAGGTARWTNPAEAQLCSAHPHGGGAWCLAAERSSKGFVADSDSCIASRRPAPCYTGSTPNEWWGVALPSHLRFRPVGYTLRDGEDEFGEHMVSWQLQRQAGNGTWLVAASHPNEEEALQLAGSQSVAAFDVPQEGLVQDMGEHPSSRSFRVQQTAPNSRGTLFMSLAGLELVGELFIAGDPCAALSCGAPRNGTCVRVPAGSAHVVTVHGTAGSGVKGALCRCAGGFSGRNCLVHPTQRRVVLPVPLADANGSLTGEVGASMPVAPAFANASRDPTLRQRLAAVGDGLSAVFGLGQSSQPRELSAAMELVLSVPVSAHPRAGYIGTGIVGRVVRDALPGYGVEAHSVPFRISARWGVEASAAGEPFVNNSLGAACILSIFPGSCSTPTAELNDAWWEVDLHVLRARISGYALRDGSRPPLRTFVRSWVLEGRASQQDEWELLDRRERDATVATHQQEAAFQARDGSRAFAVRFIRIRSTGPNSAGSGDESSALFLSGLDVFGEAFAAEDPCAALYCGDHGNCSGGSAASDVPRCHCAPGWLGQRCSLPAMASPADAGSRPGMVKELLTGSLVALVVLVALVAGRHSCAGCWVAPAAELTDEEELSELSPQERLWLARMEAKDKAVPAAGSADAPPQGSRREVASSWSCAALVAGCRRRYYWRRCCPCGEPAAVRSLPPAEKRMAKAVLRLRLKQARIRGSSALVMGQKQPPRDSRARVEKLRPQGPEAVMTVAPRRRKPPSRRRVAALPRTPASPTTGETASQPSPPEGKAESPPGPEPPTAGAGASGPAFGEGIVGDSTDPHGAKPADRRIWVPGDGADSNGTEEGPRPPGGRAGGASVPGVDILRARIRSAIFSSGDDSDENDGRAPPLPDAFEDGRTDSGLAWPGDTRPPWLLGYDGPPAGPVQPIEMERRRAEVPIAFGGLVFERPPGYRSDTRPQP